MSKTTFNFIALVLLAAITGCSEKNRIDEQPSTTNTKQYTQGRATDYGNDWIYFSFESGTEVAGINEDNRYNSLEWDLAFNRNNFRTNSGLSGKGQGGVVDTKVTALSDVTTAPSDGYSIDNDIYITENLSSFPPPQIKTPGSTLLIDAIKFSGPPPAYTLNEHVYVIKTALGKYAKIQIISFHNSSGNSGYITFRYVYQPDGTTNLN